MTKTDRTRAWLASTSRLTSCDSERKPLPPAVLLNLPPELWILIFRFATLVPGVFETRIEDPFGPESPGTTSIYDSSVSERRAIRASLVTKGDLVRVCRQWNTLAIPFLYELVHIRSWHVLLSLRDVLVRSKQQAETQIVQSPLGRCTRRLDIAMRPQGNYDVDVDFLSPVKVAALQDAIHCFPRLAQFSTRWMHPEFFFHSWEGREIPSVIADALRETCSASLRSIVWSNRAGACAFSKRLDSLLASATELTTLWSVSAGDKRCPLRMHIPPRLAYVTLPRCSADDHDLAPHPSLPCRSLHQVSMHDDDHGPHNRCLPRFLAVQGPHFTTVDIRIVNFPEVLESVLPVIMDACPHLRHLVFTFRWWNAFPGGLDLGRVTHLGLWLPNQGQRKWYAKVFVWLRDLRADALKVVRFMNPRGFMDLRDRHMKGFDAGRLECAPRKIRFEDPEGRDCSLVSESLENTYDRSVRAASADS